MLSSRGHTYGNSLCLLVFNSWCMCLLGECRLDKNVVNPNRLYLYVDDVQYGYIVKNSEGYWEFESVNALLLSATIMVNIAHYMNELNKPWELILEKY
jgi:hypothetical protein